jgi:hypothetical protein
MQRISSWHLLLIAPFIFAGTMAVVGVRAQENLPIPDLYSNNVAWIGIGNDFEQPPAGPGPVTFDPAIPYISNARAARTGEAANFRVADLTNPILQPWVIEALRAQNEEALSGVPVFDGKTRCWPPGVPAYWLNPVLPIYFLQTADEIMMLLEDNAQWRRVAMNQPHSEEPPPSWYGESVGHYEGDTLVIDTVGFNDQTLIDNYRTPHSTELHIVERIRMIDGGSQLEVTIEVEDPIAFTQPWKAVRRFRRVEGQPLLEVACAENNERYFDFDVLPLPEDNTPDF